MSIHSSFSAELAKIAMAAPGALDVSGVHMSNLEAQRQDLLDAEAKGAYVKGLLAGAALGGAIPTATTVIPALADQEAVVRGVKQGYLKNALELALRENPTLVQGMDKDQVEAAASAMSKYYYDLPTPMRQSDPLGTLRTVRSAYYQGPNDPAFVAPKGMEIVGEGIGKDMQGRQMISKKHLAAAADAENLVRRSRAETVGLSQVEEFLQGLDTDPPKQSGMSRMMSFLRGQPDQAPRVTVPFPDLPSKMDDPAEDYMLKGMRNFAQGVRELEVKYPGRIGPGEANDILEMQRDIGEALKRNFSTPESLVEKRNLKRFVPPAGPYMPSWHEDQMTGLIARIQKRHGDVKAPKNLSVRLQNALDMLKKNKAPLALASAVGGLAGLAQVRSKRERARQIREGDL